MYSLREELRKTLCTVNPSCGILFSALSSKKPHTDDISNHDDEESLLKSLSMVHQDPFKIIKDKQELISTVKDLNSDIKKAMEIITKLESKSCKLAQNVDQIKKNTRKNVILIT